MVLYFSKSNIEFEAIVNYNFGVIYLEKEKLSKNNIRKKKIWLNDVIELYEVEGYFCNISSFGVCKN